MFLSKLKSCCTLLTCAAPLLLIPAHAQDAAPKEGTLDKYINLDAKDTATKLDITNHTLYEQEQRIITLNFHMEYGDRVKLKRVAFASADRTLIPGYVFTPRTMQAGKRYPGLVMVHGGFHERFDWRWFQLVDTAVSKGYVVIFPEYRGSRGYGANHYRNEYGITDTADVLASADYLGKQSYVDPGRLGIIGQSRGGMVTLLAIQKAPDKFKAAVDIVGLTDLVAYMAYKPEYRRLEVAHESAYFKNKLPDENLAAYMEVSPINHVDKINSPLLVLATSNDKIVPLALHTGRLLDALKAKGKTYESHIYDNAPGGHIFMDGDTDDQRDAMKRTFEFVGRYLKP
ncbi:alpha/beta hydrolase family protein [Massilia cavernae]|uniref:alpha/beta hydrolase family protein n=1 Tax=Massilia cavernae TaxID=2320864 RepID=UPI0011C47F12|nr:alpha/beta fold hydrolase [Massilia cavernae]